MFTVLTSATDDVLVSLADLKDALDITDGQYDAKLTRFSRRATARIETFIGKSILKQEYRAALPSYGGPILQLPHFPIREVAKVFDGTDTGVGTELTSTEYVTDRSRGQLVRNSGWPWTSISYSEVAPFPVSGQEYPRWLVDYTAGYVPGEGTTSTQEGTTATGTTVPGDLQEAAIGLVRNMWFNRARDSNVVSKRVGELSITYGNSSDGIPQDVAALLAPYRSLM